VKAIGQSIAASSCVVPEFACCDGFSRMSKRSFFDPAKVWISAAWGTATWLGIGGCQVCVHSEDGSPPSAQLLVETMQCFDTNCRGFAPMSHGPTTRCPRVQDSPGWHWSCADDRWWAAVQWLRVSRAMPAGRIKQQSTAGAQQLAHAGWQLTCAKRRMHFCIQHYTALRELHEDSFVMLCLVHGVTPLRLRQICPALLRAPAPRTRSR